VWQDWQFCATTGKAALNESRSLVLAAAALASFESFSKAALKAAGSLQTFSFAVVSHSVLAALLLKRMPSGISRRRTFARQEPFEFGIENKRYRR
jgi:hypothetical protein